MLRFIRFFTWIHKGKKPKNLRTSSDFRASIKKEDDATLPETNIDSENRPSEKDIHPSTHPFLSANC